MDIYTEVFKIIGEYDVTACVNVFARRTGYEFIYPNIPDSFQRDMTGHSHAINRHLKGGKMVPCTSSVPTDVVKCYHLFGETLLVGEHRVGECPWKLMWTPGLKTAKRKIPKEER